MPNELGESGLVYWPKMTREQSQFKGRYVRFKVEPTQKRLDSKRPQDDYYVAEGWIGTPRRIAPIGFPIYPKDRFFGPERDPTPGLGVGLILYLRHRGGYLIEGPWRITEVGQPPKLCPQHHENGFVMKYALNRLDSNTYHLWEKDKGENEAVLLVEPVKASGEIIELLPDSGLADWLIRVLRRDKPLLSSLDLASPGWRGRLGELLETVTDEVQQRLEQGRFNRLEKALEAIAANEARLSDLIELPQFKGMLDAAIERKVESERGRIETAALEETREFVRVEAQKREEALKETREFVSLEEQKRKEEREKTEQEKQELQQEVEKILTEGAEAQRFRDEAREKVEQDASTIRAAADYLVDSRERIIRDFSAFQGLVEHARGNGNGTSNGHVLNLVATIPAVPSMSPSPPEVFPEGPAITASADFIKRRLVPSLESWGAKASPVQAKNLHAALLSCRWVAAPCPSWGVAYSEALGVACARHRVVAVEPTWLAFSDAWEGEVESFWREAVARPDVLHLLIFADINRALAQCWARPLLDLVSGLRSVLPSGLSWPENLRLMACPSADDAVLPVPGWVAAHWAEVKAAKGATPSEDPIVSGHVPFEDWKKWIGTADQAARPTEGMGVAGRSAARERSVLAETLKKYFSDDVAQEVAKEIREVHARTLFLKGAEG